MFDFWKNISKEDKIKKLNTGKNINYVASRELRKEINDWNKKTSPVSINFSKLLFKLGFDNDSILHLERFPNMNNLTIRYGNKIIELDKMYDALAAHMNNPHPKKVTISEDGYSKVYICKSENYNNFELKLFKDIVSKQLDNFSIYERSLDKKLKISVKNLRTIHFNGDSLVIKDGYYDEIIINVERNFSWLNYGIMKIDNEDKLIDYLDSITENTRIEDVYKKLCEISLGEEDRYSQIDIIFKRLEREEARLSYYSDQRKYAINSGYKYQVTDGDRNYTYQYIEPGEYRRSPLDNFKIIVSKDEEHFVLTVNPIDYVEGMKLDNELELREYLCGLEFPISISDVYKKICEISLGDINKYKLINIECYHGKDMIDEEKILSFCLENGEFISYQVIRDGKEIKISNDGKFSYINKSISKKMIIDMNGEIVTDCHFSSENGIENDDMGNSVYGAINEAKDVKVRTKKMIDNLMNRNNS